LPIDPNSRASEQLQTLNAVVLPPLQPRAYAAEDTVSLTYEGSYQSAGTAGFLRTGGELGERLEDASFSFCGAGVYDEDAMTDLAVRQLGLTQEEAQAFGAKHADFVQITSELLEQNDAYWRQKPGDLGYQRCLEIFGPHDAELLSSTRDFRVTRAFADHLELAPREANVTFSDALECFPTANTYRLRGANHWVLVHSSRGFNHDIVASSADRRCVRSCDPLKKWAKTRVFELSSSSCRQADVEGEPLELRVGCRQPDEVACVYDQTDPDPSLDGEGSAVQIGGDASSCIFDGLTERFALYRGRAPSVRDSVFTWQTTGGFSALVMNLATVSETVLPQSIQFLPGPERMAVVDGAALGLSLLSLDTFGVTRPSPFY
jgi:hypothetical protein